VPVPRFPRRRVGRRSADRQRKRCVRIAGQDLVARLSVPLQCDAGTQELRQKDTALDEIPACQMLSASQALPRTDVPAMPSGKLLSHEREFVRRERGLAARLSLPLFNTIQDLQQPQEPRQTPTRQKRTPQLAMHRNCLPGCGPTRWWKVAASVFALSVRGCVARAAVRTSPVRCRTCKNPRTAADSNPAGTDPPSVTMPRGGKRVVSARVVASSARCDEACFLP